MKYIFLFFIITTTTALYSQDYSIKKLELTTSPAYVLLGVQPTNIMRPSTPRDFTAGIQNFNINGTIQPCLALEANPFNWKKSENEDYNFIASDYFDKRVLPAIKKNFAISLATSESDTVAFGNLTKGTGLGFGLRATIFPGKINNFTYNNFYEYGLAETKSEFLDELDRLSSNAAFSTKDIFIIVQHAFGNASVWLNNSINIPSEMKDKILYDLNLYKIGFESEPSLSLLTSKVSSESALVTAEKNKASNNIDSRAIPFAKDGFILEMAFSNLIHIQNNLWDSAVYAKTGLWLTPSYRFDLSKKDNLQSLDLLCVIRYLWNERRVDRANYWDFGAKIQYNRNSWNLSMEGVSRYATQVADGINNNWTYSWIGNVNYAITEDISFRFSFGSSFNGNSINYDQPKSAIIMGGLNFGVLK